VDGADRSTEPGSFDGRFVQVRFAGSLPGQRYAALVAAARDQPLMGEWTPPTAAGSGDAVTATATATATDDATDAGGDRDETGIVLEAGTGRAVGLIGATPSALVHDAALISLFFLQPTGGDAFLLEGALRYCAWLLDERYSALHAEVLVANRRMNRFLGRIGVEPALRLRQARYFGGRWWDPNLYVLAREDVARAAARWGGAVGFVWRPELAAAPLSARRWD
jgi:RimJ/RimL family protein N-acetyltransferase